MNRRLPRLACVALFAWLALYCLEKLAEAQTTTTTTSGGSPSGNLMSGGGMSGGSTISGSSSTISGGNMSGSNGQSFSGGEAASFSGGTTSGRSTTRGSSSSSTTVPSSSNPFGPTYVNPWSLGIKNSSGTMATGTYNQAIYAPKTTTSSAKTTTPRNSSNSANSNSSFSTQGMDRGATPFITTLSEDLPPVQFAPSALQTDLRDIIQRSLPGRDKITVAVNGDVVTLRGEVASAKERSFVERLLRLEPGVRNLDNKLTVAGAASQ